MDATLLIANADAGGSDDQAVSDAVSVLRKAGDVQVVRTSSPGDLDGALHRRGGRRVVVAGGDGSLHTVVAALHRRNELSSVEIGLIPLGTGNDFARGVGIPLDPVGAAHVLLDNKGQPIDLLVDCAGDIVINAVHVGVGAEAGRQAQSWKARLGKAGYHVGALLAGVRMRGRRLRVEADGVVLADLDRPVLQVGIGNGPNVGGGTELMPGAEVDDGLVTVVVSFATGPWQRLAYAVGLMRAQHEERPDVSVTRARTVSVTGEDYWCNADGELYGPERNQTWRVEPGAVRMVLPTVSGS